MKKYFTVNRIDSKKANVRSSEDDIVLSEIQMDYNTIIMSPEFRRMQDKTQVFPLSRGDFVRTRLTHSYEVSIIAEQIARYALIYLNRRKPSAYDWTKIDRDRFVELAKTVGLVHDIGNPPFGHFGEECVRNWFEEHRRKFIFTNKKGKKIDLMGFLNQSNVDYPLYEDFLNYDGNVQGLRVVLRSHPSSGMQGMNLVQSLIHAMVKYPYDSKTAKDSNQKKFGYNFAERSLFENIIKETQTKNPRHIVTYILEAADDIAYRTADLEDALNKRVITVFDIRHYLNKYLNLNNKYDAKIYESFMELFEDAVADEDVALELVRLWLYDVRINLMKHVAHQFADDFDMILSEKALNYELTEHCYGKNFFKFAKSITQEKIYDNDSVLDLEVAAKACMYDLLDLFVDAMIAYDSDITVMSADNSIVKLKPTYYQTKLVKLIPKEYIYVYEEQKVTGDEPYNLYLRILCVLDYISSMTDRFAYEKRRIVTGLGSGQ